MSNPTSLSSLSDPTSLAKLQILVIPLKLSSSSSPLLSEATYEHWSSLIRRHQTIRSDELRRPSPESSSSASSFSTHARRHVPSARFFPTSSGTSASRAPSSTTMHLSYPSHPPARHLYPLSLLRMTIFPLVVIGVAVDPGELSPVEGYSVDEEEAEVTGDIGQASAPIASTSTQEPVQPPSSPTETFDNALQNLFPPTSPFPLVRRLVLVPSQTPSSTPKPSPAMNGRGEQQDQAGDAGKGKMLDKQTVYAPTEGVEGWVRKMMGEVVGDVLVELGELVRRIIIPTSRQLMNPRS